MGQTMSGFELAKLQVLASILLAYRIKTFCDVLKVLKVIVQVKFL